MSLTLKVGKIPSDSLAFTNKVYLNAADYEVLRSDAGNWVLIKGFVYSFDQHKGVAPGIIGMGAFHRRCTVVALNDAVEVNHWRPKPSEFIASATIETDFLRANTNYKGAIDAGKLEKHTLKAFDNQVLTPGQQIVSDFAGVTLTFKVVKVLANLALTSASPTAKSPPGTARSKSSGKNKDKDKKRSSSKRKSSSRSNRSSGSSRSSSSRSGGGSGSSSARKHHSSSSKSTSKIKTPTSASSSSVTGTLSSLFGAISPKSPTSSSSTSRSNKHSSAALSPSAAGADATTSEIKHGVIVGKSTSLVFVRAQNSNIRLEGGSADIGGRTDIFSPNWNYNDMGIGGLGNEFQDIFRRAFASRVFPAATVRALGINHVKGILLYGPPGTGKTLMARQIGKMLNGKDPKVVNGPEVLSKYVGDSEENIRKLFKDAEAEYKSRGDSSDLHIIIFDEIDAICKQRGSNSTGGTGVGDTIVNQLLSKIDGVDAIHNVLLIGMTNRRDLIDEALLRPGRLEVQIRIGLPDEAGRLQILEIHTKNARKNKHLSPEVDLGDLAARTKNFSGAEIEGLVKSATSFALNRHIDPDKISKKKHQKLDNVLVTKADFDRAFDEVKPAFGMAEDEFDSLVPNGIINYGKGFETLQRQAFNFVSQLQNSDRTSIASVLLEGPVGSGKSALAADIARRSGFPFVKLCSPDRLIGYQESGRANQIRKIFDDAYKSKLSVVVVDDIERLIDYVAIGPRFSNIVLQTLSVLIKKSPPPGHKLLVIGTTSKKSALHNLSLTDSFNSILHVPNLASSSEAKKVLTELNVFPSGKIDKAASAFKGGMGIKKYILTIEMAKNPKEANEPYSLERYLEALKEYST